MPQTKYKLSISNNVLEIYSFANPITYGEPKVKKEKFHQENEEEIQSDNTVTTNQDISYRAKKNLKRIMECNSGTWTNPKGNKYKTMFLTLTFRENVKDLDFAHNEFKKFMQRLNTLAFHTKTRDIKYLSVVEFQKRGAIHYHIAIFNLPFIDRVYDELAKIWTLGSRRILPIKTVRGAIKYFAKYITKNFEDQRMRNRKKYFTSTGLKKPLVVRDEGSVQNVKKVLDNLSWIFTPYTNTFYADFIGKVEYFRYELPHGFKLQNLDLDGITKLLLNKAQLNQNKEELWNSLHILESLQKAKIDKSNPLPLKNRSWRSLPKKADIKYQKSLEKKLRQKSQEDQNLEI